MASENKQTAEITDAERRELIMKVYPRLKKRQKFLRLLKIGNAVMMCALAAACAGVQPELSPQEKSVEIGLQIKEGMVTEDSPAEFEKTMPESDLILSTVIKFAKEPTLKHISDDVIDLDYESGVLAILKADRLETNYQNCPAILLGEDRYLSVAVEGGLALITGRKKAVLADMRQCGILKETESPGKGFALSDEYLLEFTRNSFDLYDRTWTQRRTGGDFLGSVRAGQLSGSRVMFANENGKIALMNAATGKFIAIFPDSVDIRQIYFNGNDVYVYDTENRLRKLTADYEAGNLTETVSAQAKEGCFFLKRSGRLYCDEYIFGLDLAYKVPMAADRGLVRDGLIFLINKGSLYFLDPKLVYKKTASITEADSGLCLKEGRAFFSDLDGKVRYVTAAGEEREAETMPDECDHEFNFIDGAFRTPDGKVIYRYASEVNRSEKARMMKRAINDDIYYYFDILSD